MAKKRVSNNAVYGKGNLGYTEAHGHDGQKVFLRKDHISCKVYGKADMCNAYLGDVYNTIGTKIRKNNRKIEQLRHRIQNWETESTKYYSQDDINRGLEKDTKHKEKIQYLEDLNVYLRKTAKLIKEGQKFKLNLGSSIFESKYATYSLDIDAFLEDLDDRIEFCQANTSSTEFILYGRGYPLTNKIEILTTHLRELETIFVEWVNVHPIPANKQQEYDAFLTLLNILSKWTYNESRYLVTIYHKQTGLTQDTW